MTETLSLLYVGKVYWQLKNVTLTPRVSFYIKVRAGYKPLLEFNFRRTSLPNFPHIRRMITDGNLLFDFHKVETAQEKTF